MIKFQFFFILGYTKNRQGIFKKETGSDIKWGSCCCFTEKDGEFILTDEHVSDVSCYLQTI